MVDVDGAFHHCIVTTNTGTVNRWLLPDQLAYALTRAVITAAPASDSSAVVKVFETYEALKAALATSNGASSSLRRIHIGPIVPSRQSHRALTLFILLYSRAGH